MRKARPSASSDTGVNETATGRSHPFFMNQAVAANTDLARNFGSGPGASDWGATRADVAKGAYPGGNPGLNADAKAAQGANPTHGKP